MLKQKSRPIGSAKILLSICFLCSFWGCDTPTKKAEMTRREKEEQAKKTYEVTAAHTLIDDSTPTGTVSLLPPESFGGCFSYFPTLEDIPLEEQRLPFTSELSTDRHLLGCGAEFFEKKADGTLYVGFSTTPSPSSEATNLEVRKYTPEKKLAWVRVMNRQSQALNFTANFRKSFFVENDNGTVCFGTLWQATTQTECVLDADGKIEWSGELPFWSGLTPTSGDNGFWVADLVSLTQRYPYSGVEMTYFKLPVLGGRSAVYLADEESFVFASSRNTPSVALAVDFKALKESHFEPKWEINLDVGISPVYGYLFRKFQLVILKGKDEIFALDLQNGTPLWSIKSTTVQPKFVEYQDHLYVLMRNEFELSFVEMDPKTGKAIWMAEVPSTIMSVHVMPSGLYFKSVRAVQRVAKISPPS